MVPSSPLLLLFALTACRKPQQVDADGDGAFSNVDCDDANALVSPFFPEVQGDGFDNDCDLGTSDAPPTPPTAPDTAPPTDTAPPVPDLDGDGWIAGEDCDDADPAVGPASPWYRDCDGDGFAGAGVLPEDRCGDPPAPDLGCAWTRVAPVGPPHAPGNTTTDCWDADARAWPGQTEFFATSLPLAAAPWLYDYDCDGEATVQYGLFTCYLDASDPEGCGMDQPRFAAITGCGQPGQLHEDCVVTGDVCGPDAGIQAAQRCR